MRFVTALSIWTFMIASEAFAHEMTPTYPELRPSYIDGLNVARLTLFNRREDAIYYEIEVFDKEWKPVAFASQERIIKIDYLGKKTFEVHIREQDKHKVEYICTTSKLPRSASSASMIASKICSKIKRD